MNFLRERYKKITKITDATDTLKYTIRNGLIKSSKTSTNKKLAPHNIPKEITKSQSLLFITRLNKFNDTST